MFRSALTLDIPFSRKVLEHLVAHPDEHDQGYYGIRLSSFTHPQGCGTTACIAGTAVMMDAETTSQWDAHGALDSTVMIGDREQGLEERAAEIFGLNYTDAAEVFHDYNNASALTRLESYIAAAEKAQNEVAS